MIGWQDEAKTLFLGTVLGSGIMSLILMLVVLCNIHTSALRKKIFVQELSSLSRGLFFLTLIFALTWSWYPLTYFKLQHLELPDFYPAFQIVNSWMGVFTFVGIGLGSKRFRHAIKSISKRHQKNCIPILPITKSLPITCTVLLSKICIHCTFIHNLHCSLILSQ